MGIFSGYKQGENRVTSTIMAVLQELTLSRVNTIIGALLDDGDYQFGKFTDQPSHGHKGVLDASIVSNSNLLFEVKIQRNSVDSSQLKRHLASFGQRIEDNDRFERLIVLTPDQLQPVEIDSIAEEVGDLICWANFQMLHDVVDQILDNRSVPVSERETFLLRELQSMLHNERLLCFKEKDTLIVPASSAWGAYQNANVYACQPGRSFRQADYIGFYAHGEIKPRLASIVDVYDNVVLDLQLADSAESPFGVNEKMKGAVKRLLEFDPALAGSTVKLFVLDDADSPNNIDLNKSIKNDKKSGSGKVTAFTQNQTYTHSESLQKADKTSDLVKLDQEQHNIMRNAA